MFLSFALEHGPSQWPLLQSGLLSLLLWCSSLRFSSLPVLPPVWEELAGEDRAATSLALRTLTTESPEEAPWEEPAHRNKDTTISNMLMAKRPE